VGDEPPRNELENDDGETSSDRGEDENAVWHAKVLPYLRCRGLREDLRPFDATSRTRSAMLVELSI
jgi:hypothetical protein